MTPAAPARLCDSPPGSAAGVLDMLSKPTRHGQSVPSETSTGAVIAAEHMR